MEVKCSGNFNNIGRSIIQVDQAEADREMIPDLGN